MCIAVIFVATTPKSKLKKLFENAIRESGLRLKVVERTGRTLKSQLQTSNPFREDNCRRNDCFICTTGGKGNCTTEGITYRINCQSDEECTRKNVYKGETSSNGYTRGGEHIKNLASRKVDQSPLWRHCVEQHRGEMQSFQMSVTGSYRNDAMLRQISEAVQINNTDVDLIMNDRAEWNMTRLPRTVISTA